MVVACLVWILLPVVLKDPNPCTFSIIVFLVNSWVKKQYSFHPETPSRTVKNFEGNESLEMGGKGPYLYFVESESTFKNNTRKV